MSLDIFFLEGVADRLLALRQTNERLLTLAEGLGADPRDIGLVRAAIMGTLADVAVSFGLHRQGADFEAILPAYLADLQGQAGTVVQALRGTGKV